MDDFQNVKPVQLRVNCPRAEIILKVAVSQLTTSLNISFLVKFVKYSHLLIQVSANNSLIRDLLTMIEPGGHLRWEGFARLFAQVFESDAVYGSKTKLGFPSLSNQHHLQSASVPYACIHGKN